MSFGQVNADVIGTSVAGSNIGAGNASIMKNRIINGAMVIDQRNAGASGTAINVFTTDRFQFGATQASKLTWGQNLGSITPPVGFSNYLGFSSSSAFSVGSGDIFYIKQNIEGYNFADLGFGTANAKTFTLSFQVYSSLTGSFGGQVGNAAGTRVYPFSYTVSSANTWTPISITITGDATGTWVGATNGIGLSLVLSLGAGSSFNGTAGSWQAAGTVIPTGSVSVVGTSGATFYITGVQLEVGSSATGFEYRQYGQELALCQRYYQSYQKPEARGVMNGTSNLGRVGLPLQVQMRAAPTMNIIGTIDWFDGAGTGTITALNATYTTINSIEFDAIAATGTTSQFRPTVLYNGSNTGSLTASAEL